MKEFVREHIRYIPTNLLRKWILNRFRILHYDGVPLFIDENIEEEHRKN